MLLGGGLYFFSRHKKVAIGLVIFGFIVAIVFLLFFILAVKANM